jgi:polyhydroxybutyrate depolymerase
MIDSTGNTSGAGRTPGRTLQRMIRAAATSLAIAFAAMPAQSSAAGEDAATLERHVLAIQGQDRRYFLYRPRAVAADAHLVLVLHGSGGTAERIRGFTGYTFERLADEHGFLLVYPEGYEGNWNGCRRAAPFSANRLDVDDPAFIRAVVERHAAGGRAFAFGFSGGAHLALRLALETPDLLTAITAVGANLPAPSGNDCRLRDAEMAPSLLLINGSADPINPWEGGRVLLPEALGGHDLGTVVSAEQTAAWFARRAGLDGVAATSSGPEADGNSRTAVVRRLWSAPGLAEVELIEVIGGGHTIPQAGVTFPPIVGPHSADIDAPREAWAFFVRNVRERTQPAD